MPAGIEIEGLEVCKWTVELAEGLGVNVELTGRVEFDRVVFDRVGFGRVVCGRVEDGRVVDVGVGVVECWLCCRSEKGCGAIW